MINPASEIVSNIFTDTKAVLKTFHEIRDRTIKLVEHLCSEDMVPQSMADASPTKWHLAHTSWFFEEFILKRYAENYSAQSPLYGYLFNSYYEACGARHSRPQRGMISRPTVLEVFKYRKRIDDAMDHYVNSSSFDLSIDTLIELGLHHEQQHQELILTDILNLFAQNPTYPSYSDTKPDYTLTSVSPLTFLPYKGGLCEVGHNSQSFSFDCETPRHKVYIAPFAMGNRLITNGEWLNFIADGGYEKSTLWLSDGWQKVQEERWDSPLYWQIKDDAWHSMTLHGLQPIDIHAPVCDISFFEADAFARWAGKRLPTEFEWEHAAQHHDRSHHSTQGNFLETGALRPLPAKSLSATDALQQIYGDVWEWTGSAYLPYPGFKPFGGDIAEYNNKFMSGQFVLRGGSCLSPAAHIRQTYRNFFYPHQRWQFSGLRLAEDRL